MKAWRTLLGSAAFRGFLLALLSNNLGSWCVIAALPILVANRFGAGMALVLSLGLRVIPKVLLAPLAGRLLRRFGPARIAATALCGQAILTVLLPHAGRLPTLEALVAAIGTLDLFVMPSLLALRAPVTPSGLEMPSNTLCSVADRAAKVVGPALGGLIIGVGDTLGFAFFALLIALAAIPVARIDVPVSRRGQSGSVREFLATLRDPQTMGLFIAALTYMVMLGGLRPFLFWANRDWFGGSDTAWTGLLAAQGAGALVGALVSAACVGRLLRVVSAYTLTLVTGVLEGAFHLMLIFAQSSAQAIAILALAGIPEIISTASWFTAAQQRLPVERQALLFTFSAPLWDLAFALGIVSAGMHARGWLSLGGYWALVSLTATLPLLPLLAVRRDSSISG